MNLTAIIRLKEKIAVSDALTPQECDFILDAINIAIASQNSRVSKYGHTTGRTKAGNDIGGL